MNEHRAITQTAAAEYLGLGKERFARLVAAGTIRPWFVDPDTGRNMFTVEQLAADQRRAGELAADRRASA